MTTPRGKRRKVLIEASFVTSFRLLSYHDDHY